MFHALFSLAPVHSVCACLHGLAINSLIKELSGYLASSFVLATFVMKSMRLLRITGIVSNVVFITYALLAGLTPILILHGLLLPLNIVRLWQIEAERRNSRQPVQEESQASGIPSFRLTEL